MKDCLQLLSPSRVGENQAAQVGAIRTSILGVGLRSKLILNGVANSRIDREQFMSALVGIEPRGGQAPQKAFRE